MKNNTIVENILQKTSKTVVFVFNDHTYELPISKVVEDVSTFTVATLPSHFPNEKLKDYFSKFGQILKIAFCNNPAKCIYNTAYNGGRIIHIRRNSTSLPKYVMIASYKTQIFSNESNEKCATCGSFFHTSCQPVPTTSQTRLPYNLPLTTPDRPMFSKLDFPTLGKARSLTDLVSHYKEDGSLNKPHLNLVSDRPLQNPTLNQNKKEKQNLLVVQEPHNTLVPSNSDVSSAQEGLQHSSLVSPQNIMVLGYDCISSDIQVTVRHSSVNPDSSPESDCIVSYVDTMQCVRYF